MKIKHLIVALTCMTAIHAFAADNPNYDYPNSMHMMMMQKMSPEAQKKSMDIMRKMNDMQMNHQMEEMRLKMKQQEEMMKLQKEFLNSIYIG